MRIYIADTILRQLSVKISGIKDSLLSITKGIITAYHHQHLTALTLCNQIIHNKIQLTVPNPAGFIFPHSMHDI